MIGNAKGTISMAAAAAEHPDKPRLGTRIAYGFGAGAYGVKDGGFSYFLLLFYSQVLGLEAQLVGLILLVAMIGEIVLTLRHRKDIKRQNVLHQMWRDPAKAMELKDVKPGQGL